MNRHCLIMLLVGFSMLFAFSPVNAADELISQKELIDLVKKQAQQIDQLQKKVDQLSPEVNEAQVKEIVKSEMETQVADIQEEQSSAYDDLLDTISRVQIHGYVGQGFLYSSDNDYLFAGTSDGEFQYNDMALNFYTELTDDLSVGLQVFSRDLGDVGNNAVSLDYAFADYKYNDLLGLRAGRMKMPFGLYGEVRDLDIARTSILLPQSVYREDFRDVFFSLNGFGVYGDVSMDSFGSLFYQGQIGSSSLDDDNSAVTKLVESNNALQSGFKSDADIMYVGQLIWNTPLEGLRLSGTALYLDSIQFNGGLHADLAGNLALHPVLGPLGIPTGDPANMEVYKYFYYVLSSEYVWENLTLAAEYAYNSKSLDVNVNRIGAINQEKSPEDGFYVSASYRFNDLFELGSSYAIYWSDARHHNSNTAHKDLAISTRFDISDGWVAKLEGHYMDGTAGTNIIGDEDEWFLFAAKVSYTF